MKRNHHTRSLAAALVALAALGFAGGASATLLGVEIAGCTDSVYAGAVTTDPAVCELHAAGFDTTAVVGAGIEFSIDSSREVDFTGDTVSLIYDSAHGSSSPDLFVFTELFWAGSPGIIVGLELLTTNVIDVTTAFDDNAIGLLVNSPLASSATTTVTYRILTAHDEVPEPFSLGLLGLGLAAAGVTRRRRTVDA